jgi:hypothetical protein
LIINLALDQYLDPAPRGLYTKQSRRHHTRIVEYQEISGMKFKSKIGKSPILDCSSL